MYIRQRHKIDTPETHEFIFRQLGKLIAKNLENWISWRLHTVGYNHLALAQKEIRQEINKNAEERAFPRTLRSGDQIDPIVQEIGKGRCLYFGYLQQVIRLSD